MDFLDLCSGTGAIGFEAISRGFHSVTLIDNHMPNLKLAQDTAKNFELFDQMRFARLDVKNLRKSDMGYHVIYFDPPYDEFTTEDFGHVLDNLVKYKWLKEKTVVIIETTKKISPPVPHTLKLFDSRIYGNSALYFFKNYD